MKTQTLLKLSLVVFLLFSVTAVCARLGWIATDYNQVMPSLSYQAPNSTYWFGLDIFGRNVLARGWHAAFTALLVGFCSATLATVIGACLGACAGFFGGKIDALVVWLFTVLESIPYILLLSAFAFLFGQGVYNVCLALGMTSWVLVCRLVRTEVMRHRQMEYVMAAEALGASTKRILFYHILPNVAPVLIVQFGLIFLFAVKAEVILSFLGLGVEPGYPSWGFMFDDAKQELALGIWWNFACAASMMFVMVFSLQQSIEYVRLRLNQGIAK
ncbi:MAG: ABC transporter permease [Bdellovibrionaceae bacterium]|nr:ABC transporter permease [Pseudobdellovibrionaceae bacterium]